MSDRRVLLVMALVLSARRAPAQDLAEWRQRALEQQARVAAAAAGVKGSVARKTYDRVIEVEGTRVSFATDDLSASDTAAIRQGLTDAIATLRSRYGEAGVALAQGADWTAEPVKPSEGLRRVGLKFTRARDRLNGTFVETSVRPARIESMVLAYAGERLTKVTPSLTQYNGWAALQPEATQYVELARRFATSWSGSARRCAAGALEACAIVLAPFDASGSATRYFDPSDFRMVVSAARLPALGDSLYFDARRRCVKGEDSVCARVVERIALPDPLNAQVRGTLLSHAVELGGSGAIMRAGERSNAPALETLAHIAGVSEDSLLSSWRTRVLGALDEERSLARLPVLFSSIAWGGLLLLVATKRRFL